jgi:hypothetical protein
LDPTTEDTVGVVTAVYGCPRFRRRRRRRDTWVYDRRGEAPSLSLKVGGEVSVGLDGELWEEHRKDGNGPILNPGDPAEIWPIRRLGNQLRAVLRIDANILFTCSYNVCTLPL